MEVPDILKSQSPISQSDIKPKKDYLPSTVKRLHAGGYMHGCQHGRE